MVANDEGVPVRLVTQSGASSLVAFPVGNRRRDSQTQGVLVYLQSSSGSQLKWNVHLKFYHTRSFPRRVDSLIFVTFVLLSATLRGISQSVFRSTSIASALDQSHRLDAPVLVRCESLTVDHKPLLSSTVRILYSVIRPICS